MANYDPSQWSQFSSLLPTTANGGSLDPAALSSALNVSGVTAPVANAADTSWLSPTGIFGGTLADGTKVNGWGGTAIGLGQSLLSGYLGMKQYGLAKDALKQSKEQFNKNYAAQRQLTNSQLEDRQRARVASNSTAYQSVPDYMDKNGVR